MRIFLSYASEDRSAAKALYLALGDQGHRVFFDRASLPAGEEFHNRIREAIESSQLFIFLLSAKAIDERSYTLSELEIADRCRIKLLPVALDKCDFAMVPESLKAVTVLRPDGNVTASVASEVARIAADVRRRRLKRLATGLGVAALSAGLFLAVRARDNRRLNIKDRVATVLIPGGRFIMGDGKDSPHRDVFIDGFYMDRYEVTVARYAAFLKVKGNVKPPEHWDTIDLESSAGLPAVGIDWFHADAYCRWAGKRLPTEAEWEKAARGTDGRKFPWGNDEPTPDRARFAASSEVSPYQGGLAQVGSYPKGASPFGVFDLAG
ncbi:MAG TPA: SUMF1/EgtB/PvdO family nonheme iron enzyme, partial [Terriglobales bacterium]|nr:SUMF1/EgtB/PvdO family nonheme iron enzyme [Terriglobales bacterium]